MTDWWPLRGAQLGLFWGHEADDSSRAFTTAEVVRFAARIDVPRLAQSLESAYRHFDGLRSQFRLGPTGPEQRIADAPTVSVTEVSCADEAAAHTWIQARLDDGLDPATGHVTDTAVLHLDDGTDWWFHAAHHLVCDGYGFIQFLQYVTASYNGTRAELPATSVRAVTDPRLSEETQLFWKEQLERFTSEPTLAGRSAPFAVGAHRHERVLPDDLSKRLRDGARRHGVSWPVFATAALTGYLHRLAGPSVPHVRPGVPVMNRIGVDGPRRSADTVCSAMNVLPLVSEAKTVGDVLQETARGLEELSRHGDMAAEELSHQLHARHGVSLCGPQINVIPFTTIVTWDDVPGTVHNVTAGPVADVTWTLRGLPGRRMPLLLQVDVNAEIHELGSAELHSERIMAWLDRFAAASIDEVLDDAVLLPAEEHRLVVEGFNDTSKDYGAATITQRLRNRLRQAPDQIALDDGSRTWTYQEFADRCHQLATMIQPGQKVGVCLERSAELFIAVGAIMSAGAVYVPLDPEASTERTALMMHDADVTVVLHTAGSAEQLRSVCLAHSIDLMDVAHAGAQSAASQAARAPSLDDLAYILFTSGSTGRPKPVAVSHLALDNRLAWMTDDLQAGPTDIICHKTPVTFDVSVWELLWPFVIGARVLIAAPGEHRDPVALAERLRSGGATIVHFVPSMLRRFLSDERAVTALEGHRLRTIVCSGEALDAELVAAAEEKLSVRVVNYYGPTEAAIDVTRWHCDASRDHSVVPIGTPVPNTQCFVLDERGRPSPIGGVGQLWLAGAQLAEGYYKRPELTADAFRPNPFADGTRMYRTGDLASWRCDGALEYHGRVDDQVKLRGQRLELGDVEAAVSSAVGVTAAVALVVDESLVVVWTGTADTPDALRRAARRHLGAGVQPDRWVHVDDIPVTTSGKADRRALAEHIATLESWASIEVAADPIGESIMAIMSEVLGRRVSAGDDFFASGGNSLAGLDVINRVARVWGVDVRFGDLFAHPSATELATFVNSLRLDEATERTDALGEVLWLRRPSGGPVIVALPPAGGLGWCYSSLLAGLPASYGVLALQAAGMSDGQTRAWDSLDELAKHDAQLVLDAGVSGPVVCVGWSIGGVLAHHVARHLQRADVTVGPVVMLDSYPGEQWRQLAPPDHDETLRALLRMAGVEHHAPAGSLREDDVREILAASGSAMAALEPQTIAASLATVVAGAELLRRAHHEVFDGDVLFFEAGAPRDETWLDPLGWTPWVGGAVMVTRLDAHHGELLSPPHHDVVCSAIEQAVDGFL